MKASDLNNTISSFADLKVLVIGDLILDAYFKGSVSRISPEAPVPVLDVKSKEFRLGGAANVALNIKHLGAECLVCSVIGNDDPGAFLKDLFLAEHIDTQGLVESGKRKTSIKTRLVSGFSQLLRMDEEMTSSLETKEENDLIQRVKETIETKKPDVIIFQDYDKGTLTERVIKEVVGQAKAHKIPVTVDPKRRNFMAYHGVTLFKPNLKELREGLNRPELEAIPEDLEKAFGDLKRQMDASIGFFTLSAEGVYITNGKDKHHLPAYERSIADVSGAGDTVIAVASCALAAGCSLKEIAFLSNLSGGWVCQFPGVVTISSKDLTAETEKVLSDGH